MWRNLDPCALLLGIQNDANAVENNIAVPKKQQQHRINIWSSNIYFWVLYPKELKTGTWTGICTPMFIAALFAIAKRWSYPSISLNRWMDKQNVVYTYNGILFSLKKEQHGWTPKHCAGWKKLDKKGHVLYDSIYRKIQNR